MALAQTLDADEMNIDQAQRIVVVGLGETGLSVAHYLRAKGLPFRVIDSRDSPPGREALQAISSDIELNCGEIDEKLVSQADLLIVSPGVSPHLAIFQQARDNGIEVIGDIELFARVAQAPVIAVTGSNGKSTVASLLAEMASAAGLRVRAGGNLMPPALDLLENDEPDLYVLELSSFQLETTNSLKPAAAVVLNVTEDHMDRYADINAYARAKAEIYRNSAVQVINRDDSRVCAMQAPGRVIGYGLDAPRDEDYGLVNHKGQMWLARGDQPLMIECEVRIPGRHNISNALAALALGESIELPSEAMLRVLKSFQGLQHRCQQVAEYESVRWFNDSKGTNVGATLAALDGLPGKTVLIAGGIGKSADFRPLRPVVAAKARAVVLIGRDARLIESALGDATRLEHAVNMQDAVRLAHELAEPGDNVMLSPACASFDMYRNYQERGEDFVRIVLGLARGSQ